MHLADITIFWTNSCGGVRTYLEAKQRWLAERQDIRHSLLVPGSDEGVKFNIFTLPAPRLPFGKGYRFPVRRRAWTEKLVMLGPDLIEAEDPYVLPWAALEAGQRLGVPVVGFYHSDLQRLVTARAGHWSNRWLDRYLLRLYSRFDRVLAPSRVMADKLRHLGIPADRVHVQPLGVDSSLFHPDRRDQALRRRLGIEHHVRLLVFAGRGSREKHIPLLLRVMTELGPDFHLHLVGSNMPRRLPANVSRSNGFVDPLRLSRILASSDALLHGGDAETFGLVVLEAMASGIPVVGVNAGAVAELVVPGTGLLAEPNSAASLADTVKKLFADDYTAMGRRARQHVTANYTWAQVFSRLLDHYRELTGRGPDSGEADHG
ncbi:MAG TPA: glycosyltransferase family 1 protein [Desulfobulbus sp.]|nr:glycosyltransferase family 1 protein [Desulfobulbus sp.]